VQEKLYIIGEGADEIGDALCIACQYGIALDLVDLVMKTISERYDRHECTKLFNAGGSLCHDL
jgi:hypothetical protein